MAAAKKWTWDQVHTTRQPVTETEEICVRNDLLAEKKRLERALIEARSKDRRDDGGLASKPTAPKIAQAIVDLEKEIEKATVAFTFREIGQATWNKLMGENPPTKAQQAKGMRNYNPETFPNAAMAASCVAPDGATVEHFERAAAEWGGQYDLLWGACLRANVEGGQEGKAPSALASEVLRSIGTGSEPPPES
jgi:hypothetical protein